MSNQDKIRIKRSPHGKENPYFMTTRQRAIKQVADTLHEHSYTSAIWMNKPIHRIAKHILTGRELKYYQALSKRGRTMFKNATLKYMYETFVAPYQYRP